MRETDYIPTLISSKSNMQFRSSTPERWDWHFWCLLLVFSVIQPRASLSWTLSELWAVSCELWAVSCELWAVSCAVSSAEVGGYFTLRWFPAPATQILFSGGTLQCFVIYWWGEGGDRGVFRGRANNNCGTQSQTWTSSSWVTNSRLSSGWNSCGNNWEFLFHKVIFCQEFISWNPNLFLHKFCNYIECQSYRSRKLEGYLSTFSSFCKQVFCVRYDQDAAA